MYASETTLRISLSGTFSADNVRGSADDRSLSGEIKAPRARPEPTMVRPRVVIRRDRPSRQRRAGFARFLG
jgi:hypothetical protein